MALIELRDIGKIYVSEQNVSVGIRGVNLVFDRGEFIAVTGQSGSGKSTLLNVISGMDTYEEGELFIDGEPTSHYIQKDWEEFRKKYISFIFQDYNIIESFTVLENVELALMHIDNLKERRERALELLHRVGLDSHIKHRGNQLSGGQKQRCVIARALAKDSPIILADEPTGNLDSVSSREIIQLLREVSREKLVIVVTHNFEQLEACATRHIRIFNGSVEFDTRLAKADEVKTEISESRTVTGKKSLFKNGLRLGLVRFKAKPKLSFFLCLLMILTALATTYIQGVSDTSTTFGADEIFRYSEGRLVIARRDGAPISESELAAVAEKTGAEYTVHYDYLFDKAKGFDSDVMDADAVYTGSTGSAIRILGKSFSASFNTDYKPALGRLPEASDEILLNVCISDKELFGEEFFSTGVAENVFGALDYKVVGVSYFYDNTKPREAVFTREGYEIANALSFFETQKRNFSAKVNGNNLQGVTVSSLNLNGSAIAFSFDMPKGSYAVGGKLYGEFSAEAAEILAEISGKVTVKRYYSYDFGESTDSSKSISGNLDTYTHVEEPKSVMGEMLKYMEGVHAYIVMSPDVIFDFMENSYYKSAYTQASLFYSSDSVAEKQAKILSDEYFAVPSTTQAVIGGGEAVLGVFLSFFVVVFWFLEILFIALLLGLCSSRAMMSAKEDVGIMRSMGIPVSVIKISIYIQTLISLIPGIAAAAIFCISFYLTPKLNSVMRFMHTGDYLLIFAGLLIINLILSHKYIKKIFGKSVKSVLGGRKQ